MSELYMFPEGMNGLYNQLTRVSDDAIDSLAYLNRHLDLAYYERGFLGQLITPHNEAYAELKRVFTQLQEIPRSAATRINQAQVEYMNTDHASAIAIDKSYPGANDPLFLRKAQLSSPEPENRVTALFADPVEPTALLKDPDAVNNVDMWSINPLADLVSPAAWIRQVAVWVFNVDPFERWADDISGDWKKYLLAGVAIGQAGEAVGEMGRNMLSGARDVQQAWRGQAADGFQEFYYNYAAAVFQVENVCKKYRRLYEEAAKAIKMLTDGVAGLLMRLIDGLILLSGLIAAGTATIESVAGPIIGYASAAYVAWQLHGIYQEISFVYGTAEDAIKLIKGSIDATSSMLQTGVMPNLQKYHHPADD